MIASRLLTKSPAWIRPKLIKRLAHKILSAIPYAIRPFIILQDFPCPVRRAEIWICVSTAHILMATSRAAGQSSRSFIFYSHIHNLSTFASVLGLPCAKLTILHLLLEIFKSLTSFRKLQIFVPHISPHIMGGIEIRFFQGLDAINCLMYYDDGMSSLSRKTHLFRDGFIPHGALVHSWSYQYLLESLDIKGVLPAASLESLVSLAANIPWLTGCRKGTSSSVSSDFNSSSSLEILQPLENSDNDLAIGIVLSSKALDASYVLSELKDRSARLRTYYIPHYQAFKNDPRLTAELHSIHPNQVELFIFSASRNISVDLFFGVTSSIVMIIELVLASPYTHRLNLIPCMNSRLSKDSDSGEYEDFIKALCWYRDNPQVQINGIEISSICINQ